MQVCLIRVENIHAQDVRLNSADNRLVVHLASPSALDGAKICQVLPHHVQYLENRSALSDPTTPG